MERIGVIGLGRMGSAIATRFAQQGHPVHGWTRSSISPERARTLGIMAAPTLAALAREVDLLFLSLFDDRAVRQVIGELCRTDLRGRLIIDTSTVTPAVLQELSGEIAKAGASAVDAPISGGPELVAEGTCGVFIGGGKADAQRASNAAQAISNRIHHVGPLGSGLAMKVVNNAMLQGYWVMLAEVAGLAKRAGLSLETAMTLLAGGPAANGMFKARLGKILGTDPTVGFSVAAAAKDSDVFVATAEAFGAEMATLRHAREMFKNGSSGNLAEADIAALISRAYRDA